MIPIVKEPEDLYLNLRVYEHCHFCDKPTSYWHERTNNPVCPKCSKEHKVKELPNRFKGK